MTTKDHDPGQTPPAAGVARRSVLRAAALAGTAVAASSVLAACGGGENGGGSASGSATTGSQPEPTSSPTTFGAEEDAAATLAATADVPVGGGVILPAAKVVITQPAQGEFKAFDSICTHQQCPVTNVEQKTINCQCHGSRFSIEDGSVKAGPAQAPLPEIPIKVEGDSIVRA